MEPGKPLSRAPDEKIFPPPPRGRGDPPGGGAGPPILAGMTAPNVVLLLTTCPDADSARALAHGLVERRLAACVARLPGLVSVYRWQGRLCEEAEVQLLVKTTGDRQEAAIAHIHAHHPYEVPEVLAVPAGGGLPAYLDWVVAETREED